MYLTILFFFLTKEKKSAELLSLRFTVSEYSSVYKYSWYVSIELRTNAAQLKGGDKKYNYICNFVLCPVLHLSYKNSSLINAF